MDDPDIPSAPKDTDVACQVKCKNFTGAEIYSFSRRLSAMETRNRTPHGEVKKMLAAKGGGCVKDCLTEAAKRVGSAEVVRSKSFLFHSCNYYEGLGHRTRVLVTAEGRRLPRRGYDSYFYVGPPYDSRVVSLFEEKTFEFDMSESFPDDDEQIEQIVSAQLVIRDMRVCLVFIVKESFADPLPDPPWPPSDEYEVAIEPDQDGCPKGRLPLRAGDSVSGEIYGLKLDTSVLHKSNTDGDLVDVGYPNSPNPWEFPFRDNGRAAAAWSTIERACRLLHEIDSDPTRLLGDCPQYQEITPGMILSAAFAPSRITFILDSDEACAGGAGGAALGPADTFSSLRKIVESPSYREFHEVKDETVLEYHVYVMIDASRQQKASVPRGDPVAE